MAFLTNYNFSKLAQKLKIDSEISIELFTEHIFNDREIFYILNKREIAYLFSYKMLASNEKDFFITYFKHIPEAIDDKKRVFTKGGKVKYHLNLDCKSFSNDYVDFRIPQDIVDISIQRNAPGIIEEYRGWFIKNGFKEKYLKGEIDKEYIVRQFNLIYPKKYLLEELEENSNTLVIEAENSKHGLIKSEFDVDKFKLDLEEAKRQWQNSFQCKNSRIIGKWKHLESKTDKEIEQVMSDVFSPLFVSNFGIAKFKEYFKLSKTHTYKITALLLEYLKWTYNLKDKKFDKVTLEQFGLECCYYCKNRIKIDS